MNWLLVGGYVIGWFVTSVIAIRMDQLDTVRENADAIEMVRPWWPGFLFMVCWPIFFPIALGIMHEITFSRLSFVGKIFHPIGHAMTTLLTPASIRKARRI